MSRPFPLRARRRRDGLGRSVRPHDTSNADRTLGSRSLCAGDDAIVEIVLPANRDRTNLRDCGFSFALDQRAFGPRRILVGVADADGRFRGLAHVERPDPPQLAVARCLDALMPEIRRGASAAIVWCDEPVSEGPPPADLAERFASWQVLVGDYGLWLVDWFACDDQFMRSSKLAVDPEHEWWELT